MKTNRLMHHLAVRGTLATVLCAGLSLVGCSAVVDSSTATTPDAATSTMTDGGTSTTGMTDSGMTDGAMADGGPTVPEPPTLGPQIDRVGRPAVTSAGVGTFMPMAMATERAMLKNTYNQNSDPSTWTAMYADEVEGNIAIFDGVDRMCGNQLLADADATDRYATLAGVLADDRLWIDSSSGTCAQYLAVEADATAVLANDDCGGRIPTADVIETSYSVLVAGMLTGIDDGIAMDDATHSDTDFPFLAAPSN